jgi:leader peptidase (prepilin peptidase)/N-methyltransferase
MTPLAGEALALGTAAVGWSVAAHAARRRGVALGKLPGGALAALAIVLALHPPAAAAGAVALGGIAVAAISDARTGLIFTPLTQLLGLATLTAAAFDGAPGPAAAGLLVVGGALFALHAITSGRGIGLGDVRLGCALGAGLGAAAGMTALGWAFVIGGIYGTALLVTRRAGRTSEIRFAPFIAVGTLAASLGNALP